MAYLLDANVFIQAKNLHYGFDFCPAFWDWLVITNERGVVFSIEKVGDELEAGNDDLVEWVKARGDAFFLRPETRIVPAFGSVSIWVNSQRYDPAAVHTFLQVADYYLIAHALAHGFTVVTHRVQSNDNLTEALWFYHLIILPRVLAILLSSVSVEDRIQ